jgi:hypothetical protein
MNEATLKIVLDFSKLPDTPEKLKINNAYLSDEIDSFDFVSKARRYLNNAKLEAGGSK